MRVARGMLVLKKHLLKIYNQSQHKGSNGVATELPKKKFDELKDGPPPNKDPNDLVGPICIIGAGAAGLFAAMLLLKLGIKNFTILEASDRVGGRAYSYQFPKDPNCTHNYYDIGAMRIPDIVSMQPYDFSL
jgi:NADPH-dependent 2,4-dienoyl-CoA reductase/sulfur reductase-like enzyme